MWRGTARGKKIETENGVFCDGSVNAFSLKPENGTIFGYCTAVFKV